MAAAAPQSMQRIRGGGLLGQRRRRDARCIRGAGATQQEKDRAAADSSRRREGDRRTPRADKCELARGADSIAEDMYETWEKAQMSPWTVGEVLGIHTSRPERLASKQDPREEKENNWCADGCRRSGP